MVKSQPNSEIAEFFDSHSKISAAVEMARNIESVASRMIAARCSTMRN